MNIQYLLFATIITLILFLIAMWINKTAKVFIWNYIAWFSAIISYLFLDTLTNYIDINSEVLKIQHPDTILGFISLNKVWIIIVIYFLFFVLFYKSRLFEISIKWTFSRILWYIFLPILTVINLIFTMLLIVNWPKILTYVWYQEIIKSFNVSNIFLQQFFKFIPFIIIFVPIFVLLIFLEIHIKIPKIKLRKTKNIKNEENTIEEEKKE